MSQSARQQATDDLARLGIKRGSMIWPILGVLISALTLVVYALPSQNTALNSYFLEACQAVNQLPSPKQASTDATATIAQPPPEESHLEEKCFQREAMDASEAITSKALNKEFSALSLAKKWETINALVIAAKDNEAGSAQLSRHLTLENLWKLGAETARGHVGELYSEFGDIVGGLLMTTGFMALIAFIPGVLGMIYRRNFWGWFLPPFAVMVVTTSGLVGEKTDAEKWFLFLVAQLLILLLALRLQRYTRKTGWLPPAVYNWILAGVLALVAASRVVSTYDVGAIFKPLWEPWIGLYQWQFILIGLPVLYTLLRRSDVWSSAVPKNIIICLDGTTNTPDQFESGRLAQTNVFKLFKMLKEDQQKPVGGLPTHAFNATLSKKYGDKQIGLYYSGVGNKFEYDPIVQALGGATGLGAAGVVDKAYLDIIRVYRPGDRIFIYGFSRGAAIARLLARAIDQRGAPKTIWTWRLLGRHWTLWQSKAANKQAVTEVPVAVLGCFDTVGAFGIGKNIAGINFQKLDLFKDLTVPDNVQQAYHMVALDETREEFSPTLMDPDPIKPTRLVEVWFSGDHANIGGGWGTTKLSDLTFDFLLKKVSSGYAHDTGMIPGDETWGMYLNAANGQKIDATEATDKGAYVLYPDALGQLRLWKSAVYIYKPRVLPDHAVISETVFQRMTNAAPLYTPASLFNLHDKLNKKRESVNTAIKRLKDTASLTAQEHDAILTFKDRLHLIRWPQYEADIQQRYSPQPPQEILPNPVMPAGSATSP